MEWKMCDHKFLILIESYVCINILQILGKKGTILEQNKRGDIAVRFINEGEKRILLLNPHSVELTSEESGTSRRGMVSRV